MKILTGIYNSKYDIRHIVEIYDNEAVANSFDEFVFTRRVDYTYTGKSKDYYVGIRPLSISWEMLVKESGPVRAWVDAYRLDPDERRYWCKWYRDGEEKFRGYLQLDQSRLPIRSDDTFTFRVHASDRLGQLDNFDYQPLELDGEGKETFYSGIESLRDHLINVLISSGIGDLYEDNEVMLTVCPAYHNVLMPSTDDDYLSRTYVDHLALVDESQEKTKKVQEIAVFGQGTRPAYRYYVAIETTIPGSCKKVMEEILIRENATLEMENGRYVYRSRGLLFQPNYKGYHYTKTKSSMSASILGQTKTIGSILANYTGYLMEVGGTATFMLPLKSLTVDHLIGSQNNRIVGMEWSVDSNQGFILVFNAKRSIGHVDNSANAKVHLRFTFDFTSRYWGTTPPLPQFPPYYFKWWIVVCITDGVDTYWLRRGANLTGRDQIEYGNQSWETTNAVVEVMAKYKGIRDEDGRHIAELTSEDPIPISGEMSVNMILLGMYHYVNGEEIPVPSSGTNRYGTQEVEWYSRDNFLRIISDDTDANPDSRRFVRYTKTVNRRYSKRLKYQIRLGDDPNSNTPTRLQIDTSPAGDGSALQDADGGWSYQGIGNQYPAAELLALDMARLRMTSLAQMKASLYSKNPQMIEISDRILFDGKTYIPIGICKGETAGETLKAEWVELRTGDAEDLSSAQDIFGSASGSSLSGTSGEIDRSGQIVDDLGGGLISWKQSFTGVTTDRIHIDNGVLPDIGTHIEDDINLLMSGSRRDSVPMVYRHNPDPRYPTQYTIDNATNDIVLSRPSKAVMSWFIIGRG